MASPHGYDKQYEDDIISSLKNLNEYYKYVNWDGNVAYLLPNSLAVLLNLEKYSNNPELLDDREIYKRFKIKTVLDVYKHIKKMLLETDAPLESLNVEDLSNAYNHILYLHDVNHTNKAFLIGKLEDYIGGLAILAVLDNSNKEMVGKLHYRDLVILSDLNLPESFEVRRMSNLHWSLNEILSKRNAIINKVYNDSVDDIVNKLPTDVAARLNEKLISNFYIRDPYSYYDALDHINKIKHVIDPFTGEKYISFHITFDTSSDKDDIHNKIIDLIPYDENFNFDTILYPRHLNIVKAMRDLKFKNVPDPIDDIEYSKFEHMDNMRRLHHIYDKLDKESQELIDSYPNKEEGLSSNEGLVYIIDYRPLVYIALHYDPDFLTRDHKNIETDVVTTLENIV